MSRGTITRSRRSMLALSLALLVAAGFLVAGCGGSEESITVNQVKLEEADLPGWSLKEEVVATRSNAAEKSIVKQLYAAGAVTILNQVFEKDGRELQVNFVEMKDRPDARHAEAMLESAVGGTNYIGVKGNIAIEIIGTVSDMGLAAGKLGLSL